MPSPVRGLVVATLVTLVIFAASALLTAAASPADDDSDELAARMGANDIEPDLGTTPESAPVAYHEPGIGGTTDVEAHPECAINRVTKVRRFEVPRFDEGLERWRESVLRSRYDRRWRAVLLDPSRDAPAPGGRGSSTYEDPIVGRVGTAPRAGPYRDHRQLAWRLALLDHWEEPPFERVNSRGY